MVILMHGIFSSKDYGPMPQLAKGLAKAGIASIRSTSVDMARAKAVSRT